MSEGFFGLRKFVLFGEERRQAKKLATASGFRCQFGLVEQELS